jgi:hypothetical protein
MTPPQHLWFFGRESIIRPARSRGLRVERINHPWKIVPYSLIMFQLRPCSIFLCALSRWLPASDCRSTCFDAIHVVLRKPLS